MLLKPTAQDGWFFKKKNSSRQSVVFFSPLSFPAGLVKPDWQVVTRNSDWQPLNSPSRHATSLKTDSLSTACVLSLVSLKSHTHTQMGNLKPGLPSPFAHGRKRQNTVRFLIRLTPRQCEQVKKLGAFWRREKKPLNQMGTTWVQCFNKKKHTQQQPIMR